MEDDSFDEKIGLNPNPQPRQFDRLTVVDKLYHVPAQGEATVFESAFERKLDSDEQPYSRRCKATEEWKPVDFGWVVQSGTVGMMMLRNEEGRTFSRQPSPEEQAEVASRVLRVAYEGGLEFSWPILPGESMRASPDPDGRLMIRCENGVAAYSVFAVPR